LVQMCRNSGIYKAAQSSEYPGTLYPLTAASRAPRFEREVIRSSVRWAAPVHGDVARMGRSVGPLLPSTIPRRDHAKVTLLFCDQEAL
jgi:hypothetical protein